MLPPFGLWLINLIMSKEFYITSLDNNMNRGTFQGVFAIFLLFLLSRDMRRGQGAHVPYSVAEYKIKRRGAVNCTSVFIPLFCCSALFLLLKPASW
jgi:hypothetical protein